MYDANLKYGGSSGPFSHQQQQQQQQYQSYQSYNTNDAFSEFQRKMHQQQGGKTLPFPTL